MTASPENLPADVGFVHRLARALLKDQELAQDVAQDALVIALEHGRLAGGGGGGDGDGGDGGGAGRGTLRAWLATVTRNLAARALRGDRERPGRERRAARPEVDETEARTTERLRLYRELTDAVGELPEPYRTAVTLRYLDGLPPRVIARRRRQPVDVTSQQIHRGLAMLRQRLDRRFGDRGSWLSAFGVFGLGGRAAIPVFLISSVAMKKAVAVSVLVLVAGILWMLQHGAAVGGGVGERDAALVPPRAGAAAPPAEAPVERQEIAGPAPGTSVAGTFVVRVVDTQDRPQQGAMVFVWAENGDPELGLTAEDGRAGFAAHDGAGGVLVRAPGFLRVLRPVAEFRGELRAVVGGGSVVAGLMLVDGEPAPAGLSLTLHDRLPTRSELPEPVTEMLGSWWNGSETRTDGRGRFTLAGVTADWSGHLRTPMTHWIVAAPGQRVAGAVPRLLLLDRPQRDLVLATTQLPGLEGRVVWADDGTPVPWARVSVEGSFGPGGHSSGWMGRGDAAGRFVAGLGPGDLNLRARWLDPARRHPLVEARVHAYAPGSRGQLWVTVEPAQLGAGGEVVVRLPRASIRHFRTVDEDFAPLAGAYLCSYPDMVERSGADGRGTFAATGADLLVGAPGYQILPFEMHALTAAGVAGVGTPADPFVFVLPRANRLVLRLVGPDGGVPGVRRILLRSADSLFSGRRRQSSLDRRLGSTRVIDDRVRGTRADLYRWTSTATMRADEHGGVVLHSLEPGVRCTLTVQDLLGFDLLRRELVTPASGAVLGLELVVAATPRRIGGRVLADSGAPLPGASVVLIADRQHEARTTTDAGGAFVFDEVCAPGSLRIVAESNGYATRALDLEPVHRGRGSSDPAEVEVRLSPSREVVVRIVDSQGTAVPLHAVLAVEPELHPAPQHLGTGVTAFTGLPPGLLTFRCEIGDRRFELEHDTAVGDAVLRVPRVARAVVVPLPEWPEPTAFRLEVTVTPLDRAGEVVRIGVSKGGPEVGQFLLPGRYRFALEDVVHHRFRPTARTPLGPSAEVDLAAGETTRIELR